MKHLIFDTETTGLPKSSIVPLDKQPRVVEFAAILWNDETGDEQEHDWLIDPGIPIPPDATKVSRITDDMVKGAPTFAQKGPAIRALLVVSDVMVVHNLFFDVHMLSCEFRRAGIGDLKWPKGICTVEATEHLQGHRLKLAFMHRILFDEDFPGAHRAMADVRALLRCYKELLRRKMI